MKAIRVADTVKRTSVLGWFFAAMTVQASPALNTYFNHHLAASYTEPYRSLTRPGDDLEARLIAQVESAKKTLWIAVQEIRLPKLAKAIAGAHRQGVDVRLIIENSYNYDLREIQQLRDDKKQGYHGERNAEYLRFVDKNGDGLVSHDEAVDRDAVYILRDAKVPLSDDTADGSAGSGLMHHKFMIIDGRSVAATSANFTMSDVHGDFTNLQTLGNANSLLEIDDQRVAEIFAEEFLIMWGRPGQSPRFGVQKPYRAAQTARLRSGETVTIQFSGTSRKLSVEESTLGLILRSLKDAKTSIDMALFVFSEAEFSEALRSQREKAPLNIRALIEPTFAYRYYSKALDMWGIQLLPQNCRPAPGSQPWGQPVQSVGVPELPKGDFLHHKFAVVDGHATIVGSHNWSRAAATHNDETLLVIDSADVAQKFSGEFEGWYQNAKLGAPTWLVREANESQRRCGF